MKRRRALKNIGLATSTGILLSNVLGACSEDDEPVESIDFDGNVLVIGAGASGLQAASLLNQKGINVSILEASGQIGGRVRSIRGFDDFPVELGADIIYGSNTVWADLLNDLNVPTVNPSIEFPDKFVFDGSVLSELDLSDNNNFREAQNFASDLASYNGASQSLEAAVGEAGFSPFMRVLEGQIGNRYGSDLGRLGYRAIAEAITVADIDSQSSILTGNLVQDILLSRYSDVIDRVQFDTVVQQIDYSGDQIVINTSQGEFTADRIIITVPVSIIKSGDITFNPSLPNSKISSLSNIGMDAAIKVFLRFNRNFWGDDIRYIYGGSLIPTYVNAGAGRSERNRILLAEAYGADAEVFSDLTDTEVVQQILAELNLLFDGNATDNNALTEFAVANWTNEEYIRGGFSYQKVGATNEDRIALSETIDNKLYFAGEAANVNGQFGTIQGALEAAERAVGELIENITTA